MSDADMMNQSLGARPPMSDTTALAPCPLCGNAPTLTDYRERQDESGETIGYASVECRCPGSDGGLFFHFKTPGEAIAAWNRRPSPVAGVSGDVSEAARHPLEAYADSYKTMSRMGDGRVDCRSVEVDIRQNMIPVTCAALQSAPASAETRREQADRLVAELDAKGIETLGNLMAAYPGDPTGEIAATLAAPASQEPVAFIVERPLAAGGTEWYLPFLRAGEEAERYRRNNPDEKLVPLYASPAREAGPVVKALEKRPRAFEIDLPNGGISLVADEDVARVCADSLGTEYHGLYRRSALEPSAPGSVNAELLAALKGMLDIKNGNEIENARAAIANAALAPSAPVGWQVPEGWKLVPVEPTEAMVDAGVAAPFGRTLGEMVANCWQAMLSAAPLPSSAKEPGKL